MESLFIHHVFLLIVHVTDITFPSGDIMLDSMAISILSHVELDFDIAVTSDRDITFYSSAFALAWFFSHSTLPFYIRTIKDIYFAICRNFENVQFPIFFFSACIDSFVCVREYSYYVQTFISTIVYY